jgi:nitrite reductase (NADH) small subunit
MNEGLVRICSAGDLPAEGEVRECEAGDITLCVARLNGTIAVLDNECPHHGGPLGQGMLENGKVICPWHAFAFDLVTGISEEYPKVPVKVYTVTMAGEDVLVRL